MSLENLYSYWKRRDEFYSSADRHSLDEKIIFYKEVYVRYLISRHKNIITEQEFIDALISSLFKLKCQNCYAEILSVLSERILQLLNAKMHKIKDEGFTWVRGTGYDPIEFKAFTFDLHNALNQITAQ